MGIMNNQLITLMSTLIKFIQYVQAHALLCDRSMEKIGSHAL